MELEGRFTDFVRSLINAEVVDELELTAEQERAKKPDFFFLDRELIGEMKMLKTDTAHKAQKILSQQRNRPEYPVFYGKWDSNKVLRHLPDGEQVNLRILDKILSGLEKSLEKANRQIRSSKESYELEDSEGILIVLNESVDVVSPEVMTFKVAQLLMKKDYSAGPRYPHISMALLISETHVLELHSAQKALPCILVINDSSPPSQRTLDYVNWLQSKWASFNGMPFVAGEVDLNNLQFSKNKEKEDSGIPLRRSDFWAKQYRQAPYLRHLDEGQLAAYFGSLYEEIMPAFIKGTHAKPSQQVVHTLLERGTHLMEEINYRGLDMRLFAPNLHQALERFRNSNSVTGD